MGRNPSATTGAKLPVTRVTWFTYQEFSRRLNNQTNGSYRLPTEADCEYACRAGTTTTYSVGDRVTKDDFNYDGPSTKPVGSYKPNAFGLYDMHGNVWEWCEDWYGPYPNGKVNDPLGVANGTHRILRGGRFGFAGWDSRSANRDNYGVTPNGGFPDSGFRLVKIK